MKTSNLMLTSVLTVAVIGSLGMVMSSTLTPVEASAATHFGHVIHGREHGAGRHCGAMSDKTGALASAWLSIELDLTDHQQAALAPVVEVIDAWHADARRLCDGAGFESAPAALGELARAIDRTRSALDALIPAFDAFYATLTAQQQATLNSWISDHHAG